MTPDDLGLDDDGDGRAMAPPAAAPGAETGVGSADATNTRGKNETHSRDVCSLGIGTWLVFHRTRG